MDFVTPKDLLNHFECSLKTIYNHINKSKWKIRTRKINWKKFVHFEDFKIAYNGGLQSDYNALQDEPKSIDIKNISPSESPVSKLQNELQKTVDSVNQLSKRNSNLEEQISKYWILLTEEKKEKKEILTKFTNLQSELTERVEAFSKERLRRAKKYYIILGVCVVLMIILIIQVGTPLLNLLLW